MLMRKNSGRNMVTIWGWKRGSEERAEYLEQESIGAGGHRNRRA
jgi:hypothetical protein